MPALPRFRAPRMDPARWLLTGHLMMFTGVAALFPIVPLYVAHRGGGAVVIALFIAGPLVVNTLVQVPAGRLTDRIGRRPVLLGSRLLYSGLSIGLFADVGPLWLLAVLRCGQGLSSGSYIPALRATLADLTAPDRRSERFAQLQAVEMVALLVGPLIGGVLALWRDNACFGFAGVAVLLGLSAIRRLPETRPEVTATPEKAVVPVPRGWWLTAGIVVPGLGLAATGCMFSAYDVVWPQYLTARGNSPLIIGMSISLFAIPILLLARRGGRLADRGNRRVLLSSALALAGVCAFAYPPLRALPLILLVGIVEGLTFILIEPICFAVISDAAPGRIRGRAMGVGGLFQFGGSGFGAAVLGSLYGVGEPIPFLLGGGILLLAALVCSLALPRRGPTLVSATHAAGVPELEALS